MKHITVSLARLSLALLFGCNTHAQTTTEEASIGASYEVHEWGLVRFHGGQGEPATSGHNYRAPWPMDMAQPAKPLIYFHPLEGFDPATTIDAEIAILGGSVREVWPTSMMPQGERFTWSDIQITPNAPCGAEYVPSLDGFPCTGLLDGGVCETAEMHAYLQPVPHCLSVGGQPSPVLLYNGYSPPSTVTPVEFVAETNEVVNTSADPVGPMWVYTGSPQTGPTFVHVAQLASQERASLGSLPVIDHPTMLHDLEAALKQRGLTTQEAADFMAAWAPDVLNPGSVPFQAIGLYDQATMDAQYPLTLTPAPDRVVRVIGFTAE